MRKIDILTALIVIISIFLFLKPEIYEKTNEVGLISAKIVEGPPVVNGGRNGTVLISFLNPTNETLNCSVHWELSQFFYGKLLYDDLNMLFEPNLTSQEIPIFLPNGDNKVTVNANC